MGFKGLGGFFYPDLTRSDLKVGTSSPEGEIFRASGSGYQTRALKKFIRT
jgi:hypothetical protein